MLVVNRNQGSWEDNLFQNLPQFLRPGDCLILNDTRVMPSRIYGRRAGGNAEVEVLFLKQTAAREWQALVRPGRRLHEGAVIELSERLGAMVVDTGERGERTLRLVGDGDLNDVLAEHGHTPLPPYIRRGDTPEDRDRYQTVFARNPGSAAAPTAGLHFTEEVLDRCRAAGAIVEYVTLHVGLGTFAPLRTINLSEVKLHSESYSIADDAATRIKAARRRIAVGTTTARTLETWAATGRRTGDTNLFISPGYEFRAVDALLTNFHLPESSLLMLVCAFGGKDLVLAAYRHAVGEHYRFFSYGDCMLAVD